MQDCFIVNHYIKRVNNMQKQVIEDAVTVHDKVVDAEILGQDKRDIKEQLASVCLCDSTYDCPTYGAMNVNR